MSDGSKRAPIGRFQAAVGAALRAAGVGRGDKVVVACSHGPDSLALADVLLALRDRGAVGEVTLVYVDHGFRPESEDEAAGVDSFAWLHSAQARVVKVKPRSRSEDAARAARYAALDRVADEVGADWIAFGHTASDQAETVVLRLIRGTGLAGLAGIPPVRGRYLRPLLSLSRDEVQAYVDARSLLPSHDSSNDSRDFTRNRVRQTILPALRAENPEVDAALGRAAGAVREWTEALDWMVRKSALDLVRLRPVGPEPGSGFRLDAGFLMGLPTLLAKSVLAHAAAELDVTLEARHIEALLALADAEAAGSRSIKLPGMSARREYDYLFLEPVGAGGIQRQVRVDVTGPDGPYRVRAWLPGDRMCPVSLKGRSRKLQDLFTDRKIPAAARRQAVVVVREADGAIVWTEYIGPAVGISLEVTLTEIAPQANT